MGGSCLSIYQPVKARYRHHNLVTPGAAPSASPGRAGPDTGMPGAPAGHKAAGRKALCFFPAEAIHYMRPGCAGAGRSTSRDPQAPQARGRRYTGSQGAARRSRHLAKLANVERRRARNKAVRSAVKTSLTRAEKLIGKKEAQAGSAEVVQALSTLDRAAKKGVIHPNQAARRKSRLMKKLNRSKKD